MKINDEPPRGLLYFSRCLGTELGLMVLKKGVPMNGWPHVLLELYDCNKTVLADLDYVRTSMVRAAEIAQATIVEIAFHQFNPIGISGMVIISESHISIHTWPEHCYAAVDIFTCGDVLGVDPAVEFLIKVFSAQRYNQQKLWRGTQI